MDCVVRGVAESTQLSSFHFHSCQLFSFGHFSVSLIHKLGSYYSNVYILVFFSLPTYYNRFPTLCIRSFVMLLVFHDYYLSVQALDSQSVSSCFGSSKKQNASPLLNFRRLQPEAAHIQMSIDALSSTVQCHGYRKSQTALRPSAKWLCDLGISQLTSLCCIFLV